jgi:hypothetical protein
LEWRTQRSQAEASKGWEKRKRSGRRRMDEEEGTETAIFFSLRGRECLSGRFGACLRFGV